MIKLGFELEAFVLRDGSPIIVPTHLPYDECGWLAEIRSEPHTGVRKAVHLLLAEKEAVEALAIKENCVLSYVPLLAIPRAMKVQAARKHGKGIISYQNIYGHETHKNSTNLATASLHVSFTNEQTFKYTDAKERPQTHTYNGFVDHAKLIVGLDKAFKDELKASKRNPGFYERKGDGRIEYRSLPNNVDLTKVAEVLTGLLK